MILLKRWLGREPQKPRRITRPSPTTWKARFILLVSFFGALWLFAEPLPAFGIGVGLFQSLGLGGYAGLLVLSVIFTSVVDYYKRTSVLGRMSFVRLKIVLTQDGTSHLIEVPEEMLVRVFIELFIKDISKRSANPIVERWDMFETTLLVESPRESNEFKQLSNNKTIREVGLQDDDVCRLYGRVLEPSIIYSHN